MQWRRSKVRRTPDGGRGPEPRALRPQNEGAPERPTYLLANKRSRLDRRADIAPKTKSATPDLAAETLFIREAFSLPGKVISASVEGGSDDDLLGSSINERHIFGEDSGFSFELPQDPPLDPSLFLLGANLITPTARNVRCCHSAFGAALTIEAIPLPATAPLLAAWPQ